MNEAFSWPEGEDVYLDTPTTSNQLLSVIAGQIGQMSLKRGREEFQEMKKIINESKPTKSQWPLGVSMLMITYNPRNSKS